MDLKDISQIVKLMDEHGLTSFHLEQDGVTLKLKKGADAAEIRELLALLPQQSAVAAPAAITVAQPHVAAALPVHAPAESAPQIEGAEIPSPMVGTFYSRPSPEAPAFCKAGDQVAVGQVICIIEAMKVMNEIKAEKAGVVTAVLVEDGTPVQYGDVLFRIK